MWPRGSTTTAIRSRSEVADDDLAIGRYTVDGGLDEVTGPLGRSDLRDIGDELEIDLLDPLDVVGDELEIDGRRWAVAATACIEPAACGGFVVARPFPSYVDHLRDRPRLDRRPRAARRRRGRASRRGGRSVVRCVPSI
ncbi:MAG: hypothetical protein R2713_21880 [Ilumatobacteraceae bacterium]